MPAMGVLTDRHTRDFKTRQKLDGMLSPVWEHQGRLLKGGDTGLSIKECTGVRQAKTVSLNNTASSYHEHSGLKVYWWGGEEGERQRERVIEKMMAFELDLER